MSNIRRQIRTELPFTLPPPLISALGLHLHSNLYFSFSQVLASLEPKITCRTQCCFLEHRCILRLSPRERADHPFVPTPIAVAEVLTCNSSSVTFLPQIPHQSPGRSWTHCSTDPTSPGIRTREVLCPLTRRLLLCAGSPGWICTERALISK